MKIIHYEKMSGLQFNSMDRFILQPQLELVGKYLYAERFRELLRANFVEPI
jgi:hypothetical protein